MSSKPFDLIPLLRAPLVLNSAIGLILSAVSAAASESSWRSSTEVHNIMCALIAFTTTSMLSSAVFLYADHRRGAIKLPQSRHALVSMLSVLVDSAVGLALLVLHIDVSVNASRDGNTILYMYAGMAALPASIFHGILALHSLVAAIRARRLTKTYCPTCSQRLRGCHSPDLHGQVEQGQSSMRGENKFEDTPTTAGKGSLDGDRLIIAMNDEA